MMAINTSKVVRDLLLDVSAVEALVGTRIYVDVLPEGYDFTAVNPAIVIDASGGGDVDERGIELRPVFGIYCVGASQNEANDLWREVMRGIGDIQNETRPAGTGAYFKSVSALGHHNEQADENIGGMFWSGGDFQFNMRNP